MFVPVRAWRREGTALLDQIAQTVPQQGLAAWYIGQEGFVLKGEATVCVDPVLNDLGEDGASVRLYPPPFAPEDFAPDFVLCTHGHADHMALPTLTAMAAAAPKTRFLVPAGCVEELAASGVDRARIVPMTAGVHIDLPGLCVTPVQAAHPVHETDAQGRDLALCLLIEMQGVRVLHMGDTYLTDRLLADLTALPQPDVMLTPINGGDYFRTARNCIGNLDPLESAQLAVRLHAGLTIPLHFDMIVGNTRDPLEFVRLLWSEDPTACFRIPALGERLWLNAAD